MKAHHEAGRYNAIMRYAKQLSLDLSSMTGKNQAALEKAIEKLVSSKIPRAEIKEEETVEEATSESEETD